MHITLFPDLINDIINAIASCIPCNNMDSDGKCCDKKGLWLLSDHKKIKLFGGKKQRIAFQRNGKYSRGISLSLDGFLKMEDVSLVPKMRLELEPNVFLTNYGNHMHLVKYCITHDEKRCEGGFFSFTPSEWMHFWNDIRWKIIETLNKTK